MKLNVVSVGAGSMPGNEPPSRRVDLYRNPDKHFFNQYKRF
jgi:hypothetical protein